MYQFLDRKLDELGAPAAFLVGSMRLWVASVQQARCPCRMTGLRFAKAGLGKIADDFSMAMFTLNGDALQQLHFAPPGCPNVRDDEARLLALFEGAAQGDHPALRVLASTLVDDTAIPRLIQAASIVARHVPVACVPTRLD
jgi:hypothetical protein